MFGELRREINGDGVGVVSLSKALRGNGGGWHAAERREQRRPAPQRQCLPPTYKGKVKGQIESTLLVSMKHVHLAVAFMCRNSLDEFFDDENKRQALCDLTGNPTAVQDLCAKLLAERQAAEIKKTETAAAKASADQEEEKEASSIFAHIVFGKDNQYVSVSSLSKVLRGNTYRASENYYIGSVRDGRVNEQIVEHTCSKYNCKKRF